MGISIQPAGYEIKVGFTDFTKLLIYQVKQSSKLASLSKKRH